MAAVSLNAHPDSSTMKIVTLRRTAVINLPYNFQNSLSTSSFVFTLRSNTTFVI